MTTLISVTAKHCTAGGSDKVWAMALIEDEGTYKLLSLWGRRGAGLQTKLEPFTVREKAEAQLLKKAKEKVEHYYDDVDWQRPDLGVRATLEAMLPGISTGAQTVTGVLNQQAKPAAEKPRAIVSHLLSVKGTAELERLLDDDDWGLSEKVNGRRTLVEWDGSALQSYNRQGQRLPTYPMAAADLATLGTTFLIDGERLEGDRAGEYAMFDLLEWDGEDIRAWPYLDRINQLHAALVTAGLGSYSDHVGPTDQGLHLLLPAIGHIDKRDLMVYLRTHGREGAVLRKLSARSREGNTPDELKFKFLAELDAFVTGTKEGRAGGSITIGLVRPDGKTVSIGSVRSGLMDPDIAVLRQMLEAGDKPVLTIGFLPVRTIGMTLVEPTTSLDSLRDDKSWDQCSTEQLIEILGEDRRVLIDAA